MHRWLADVAGRADTYQTGGGRSGRDQGARAGARAGRRGEGGGAKEDRAGEGVLRRVLGTPSPRPLNYELLRRFPHVLFPVVAQDPREAEEPGQRVVRRVPDHRRRVGPLAPGRRGLVL